MSDDVVDDLHQAEDFAGSCAASLEQLLAAHAAAMEGELDAEWHDVVLARARSLVEQWNSYCRPTCGAEGNAGPGEGDCQDDDCCGCPCHDRFEAQS